MSRKLVECVPNISEGRDAAKIKQVTIPAGVGFHRFRQLLHPAQHPLSLLLASCRAPGHSAHLHGERVHVSHEPLWSCNAVMQPVPPDRLNAGHKRMRRVDSIRRA